MCEHFTFISAYINYVLHSKCVFFFLYLLSENRHPIENSAGETTEVGGEGGAAEGTQGVDADCWGGWLACLAGLPAVCGSPLL